MLLHYYTLGTYKKLQYKTTQKNTTISLYCMHLHKAIIPHSTIQHFNCILGTYKRVLLSIVAVCTLVFVASMVVIALSQGLQTGSLSAAGQEEEISRSIRQDAGGWGKIWMLQVEHDWGAFAYM